MDGDQRRAEYAGCGSRRGYREVDPAAQDHDPFPDGDDPQVPSELERVPEVAEGSEPWHEHKAQQVQQ
jgi:hypothetical protein